MQRLTCTRAANYYTAVAQKVSHNIQVIANLKGAHEFPSNLASSLTMNA